MVYTYSMRFLATLVLLAAIIGGIYYYHQHQASINLTAATGIDAALTTELKGVAPASLAYYASNRNYGTSATKNICDDTTSATSMGAIIGDIQTYTNSISCTVDGSFPAKSFTVTAPSFVNKGQYFCTDQNGVVDLIPGLSSSKGFKAGLSCK